MVFQRQIRQKQIEAHGRKWQWETLIPGPLSMEEAELIMSIAGCWCNDPSKECVKFYSNQNHISCLCRKKNILAATC